MTTFMRPAIEDAVVEVCIEARKIVASAPATQDVVLLQAALNKLEDELRIDAVARALAAGRI